MTFWKAVYDLRKEERIPRQWRTGDLKPHLRDRFSMNYINMAPSNHSVSKDGKVKGAHVKRGYKAKAYRLGNGLYELIDDPSGRTPEQTIRQKKAPDPLTELCRQAKQGLAETQFLLGFMYDTGRAGPQNYLEAAGWFRKAAEQGLAKAQRNLGVMYAIGRGVPQDYVQAHKWMNLAASRATAARFRSARDELAEKMTTAQITEAQRLARE